MSTPASTRRLGSNDLPELIGKRGVSPPSLVTAVLKWQKGLKK